MNLSGLLRPGSGLGLADVTFRGRAVLLRHNDVTLNLNIARREPLRHMPSLFRFLLFAGIVGAVVFGGLYAVAVFFEPVPRETSTPVPGVKVRR
jgi:hypothetical protein